MLPSVVVLAVVFQHFAGELQFIARIAGPFHKHTTMMPEKGEK